MQFMLLIHGNERAMMEATPTDATGMTPDYAAYNMALVKAGAMVAGERLRPTTDAASVRIRNGRTEVLDGPYADTKEQFGGFYIIEAPDLDKAMDWALQCPASRHGTIEVRPVVQG
ncbi:YciI family protein [Devosia aquimaris]|uniref:YciI family protein n=1 Tax=Devosia aquimaris TaxID=2866214 RepID=UPI001CD0A16D|nr:YciI family protein [Devosia sp. CJK-A8-3]